MNGKIKEFYKKEGELISHRNIESAFNGALGSVLMLCIYLVIGISLPDDDDPPAGFVMYIAMLGGIIGLTELLLWIIGIVNSFRIAIFKPELRANRKVMLSYILLCIPPGYILWRLIIG